MWNKKFCKESCKRKSNKKKSFLLKMFKKCRFLSHCVITLNNCIINIYQNNFDYDFCHNQAALCQQVYLLEDKVNGATRIDVHKVNISVVVDELSTPCHCVREAALNLETQFRLKN